MNRLFHDVVISHEALLSLTEGRMMRFKYGKENHAEIAGPGSYVLLDLFPSSSESDYDSDGSKGIPPKDLIFQSKNVKNGSTNEELDDADDENNIISVEDSVIEITLNNVLLKDGASVVVSPSCSVFDCQEFLDYMTSTTLPFIIYAIEHDSLTEQVILQSLIILRPLSLARKRKELERVASEFCFNLTDNSSSILIDVFVVQSRSPFFFF